MTKFRAQFSAQTTQNWAQFRTRMTKSDILLRVNDQNLVTIQHANETRSGHNFEGLNEYMVRNLQAFYKHFYIGCLKTQKTAITFLFYFFLYSGRALCKSSRVQYITGRAQCPRKYA